LERDSNHAGFLLLLFVFTLALTAVHISFLPPKEILKQKITDQKMPVYTIIGIITSLVAALCFGRS
jgi:glucose uptake protein GlcU